MDQRSIVLAALAENAGSSLNNQMAVAPLPGDLIPLLALTSQATHGAHTYTQGKHA